MNAASRIVLQITAAVGLGLALGYGAGWGAMTLSTNIWSLLLFGFWGFEAGFAIGCALGVWLVPRIRREPASFRLTLAGSLIGCVIAFFIGEWIVDSFLLYVVLPVAAAVVTSEQYRKRHSGSR